VNKKRREKGQERKAQAIIMVHPSSRTTSSLSCNTNKKNITNQHLIVKLQLKYSFHTTQEPRTPLN